MSHRDLPNSMKMNGGQAAIQNMYKRTEKLLNALPYNNRGRVPLYCNWLTKIAQEDRDVSTIWILNTRWVIELAARLDTVDALCLPDVIDALPHTPDFDKMIADEREDCTLQYPNHHCNEIVRPRSQPVK